MLKHFVLVLLIFILIPQCTSINKLKIYNENQPCDTVIEGYYNCKRTWYGKVPVLFQKDGRKNIAIYGDILKQKVDGFLIDRHKISPLSDPEPKFYNIEKISAVFDSNRQIIYGALPDKYYREW